MSIIDVIDNKVVIKPEALLITPFREIWESDKDKSKKAATDKIKYIWLYADRKSPFRKSYPEPIRSKAIIDNSMKDFKVTKDVTNAIEVYTSIHTNAEMRMLDGVEIAIYKMEQYFRDVNFESDSIKQVTESVLKMPQVINSLKAARKAAESEEDLGTKVRGNAELGQFE